MAHVSIISSQSGEQIFEGAPRYIGAYLKPGYLEFQAIGSPTAISWHVGDYVVYPRTGKTYRLYRTPQIAEQGDTMRYGAAFLYENVQFFDDSKQLELCPFTDLVPGDNTVHFSTQNVVSFFGKPLNVAERVQACLENQYGSGTWAVRIVTTTDADLLELLDTEVEFSVSGASCQQALDKVYELWNGLGWIHTVENGVNVITIGASNVRTNANTTVPFAYDDGLVRVERSIANADQIGTRLFAYGSMKNMDATYYRGLDIKDAESVDIEHLMIPLANWGLTDNKPDARKAYIEDAAAIAKLGLIPRTAYFDGTGDLPDIHPTIERMTIGEVYDAGGAGYLPNLSKWSRDQRIDEIVSAVNPTDHGTSAEQGQKYTEDISSHLAALTDTFINNDTVSWTIFSVNTNNPGRLTLNFGQEPQPIALTTAWTPQLDLKLAVYAGGKRVEAPLTIRQASSTAWQIILPESVSVSGPSSGLVEVRIEGVITNTAGGQTTVEGSFSTDASTAVTGGIEYELSKTFTVTIPQIGFDIEKYAALGNGKTISMKTGMCAGRDFEIKSAKYVSSTDSWLLTLYRSSDEDLGIMFPNADYQIAAGDQYVLLDIAMPDMYVTVASNRLLEASRKLLADISSERPFYSPQIDAKVVYNESRVLLEGMWMDVAFDSSREYVLIDSITIDENGSNIPTYEVSLREKKGVEWTENVGKSSSSKSSVSVNGVEQEQAGSVSSVGMTVPTGLTVQGSPITSAGIFKVGLAEGYKIPLISELANYFELATDPTIVQLRQAYSYLGPRKGLIFEANEEADTNADFEKVALPGGGYALHSKLPFYSDSFISAGGLSQGGGASGGNAILVAKTYGGTLSATGIDGINFYSKERVDQLLLTAGTVQTVAGVSPTSGDIPVASLKSALGLGAAAAYGIGSVASGNTGLVTGGSVYSAINEAVSSVMKMQGTTTTPISDGSTTNPVVIDGSSYTAKKGDVVLYDGKEYLWAGSAWEQLGDEASWALKTTSISAGTGLEGGGTLASNRTISINSTYQTYINHGESAYNSLGDYLLSATAASTYATITALNGVSGRVTTLEGRTNWDTYFGVDENGDIYVKKNGATARNFYSWGAVSAGGLSDGGGSGGIDPEAMWQLLGDSTNEQIAASHLSTALNGYATQSWVTGRGYITGINSTMVTNALGYTPANPSSLGSFAYKNSLSVSDIPDLSGTYATTNDLNSRLFTEQVSVDQSGVAFAQSYMDTHQRAFVYNTDYTEWSYLFGFNTSKQYGAVLKFGYNDKYIYTLRKNVGNWQSQDWEKISAGYADSAGDADTLDGQQGAYYATASSVTTLQGYFDSSGNANSASTLLGVLPGDLLHCKQEAVAQSTDTYIDSIIALGADWRKSLIYNSNGDEWAYLTALNSNAVYGSILRFSYGGIQLRTRYNGAWSSAWQDVYWAGNCNKSTTPWTASFLIVASRTDGIYFEDTSSSNRRELLLDTYNNFYVGSGQNSVNDTYLCGYNVRVLAGSGVEKVTILSDGRVGFSTTAPDPNYLVTINGGITAGTCAATSLTCGDTSLTSAHLWIRNLAAYRGGISYDGSGDEAMIFSTGYSETPFLFCPNVAWDTISRNSSAMLTIWRAGVGVNMGTTKPTTATFQVNGTAYVTTGIWTEGYISAGAISSSSDERLKSGIKDFGYSAEMLMALRPREWDWNEKSYMKGHAAGVVAQELRQVMPYAIVERQYLSVNYDMLHALEISGLQDHERRIRQLERENAELKRRLNMN